MKRTQIQLPDELYQRAKVFAAQRELSLDTNILIQQGVTEFATVNEKDFRDCGFKRVWNSLAGD